MAEKISAAADHDDEMDADDAEGNAELRLIREELQKENAVPRKGPASPEKLSTGVKSNITKTAKMKQTPSSKRRKAEPSSVIFVDSDNVLSDGDHCMADSRDEYILENTGTLADGKGSRHPRSVDLRAQAEAQLSRSTQSAASKRACQVRVVLSDSDNDDDFEYS